MATVNNWLAFSLSPQDLPPSQTDSTLISAAATDEVSGDVCFNIPQDWGMRGSELSALVSEPKLEDFLGGINFSEQHHKANLNVIPSSSSTCYASSGASSAGYHQLYHHPSSALHFADSVMVASSAGVHDGGAMISAATASGGAGAAGANGGSIGLSMIKNWLRSQPAPGPAGADLTALAAVEAVSTDGSRKVTDSAESVAAVVDTAQQRKAVAAVDTFGQRTSIYRGVTKHRWTGRYEAHLWDNSCRREGQTRKGRQVYLGGYDKEEKAARAYDLAALKYWGTTTTTNFPMSNYEKELEEMKHMSRQEYVASLRRKSSGFSRGASIYRGVTRHHQHGRWQARIGRVAGNKDLYLGTLCTQEEAAEAYDIAAIKFRGLNAVTNFDMSRYDVKSIMESSALPVGGTTKCLRDVPDQFGMGMNSNCADSASHMTATKPLTDGIGSYAHENYGYSGWSSSSAMTPIPLQFSNGHEHSRLWCKPEQDSAVVAAAHNLHHLQHFTAQGGTHNFFHPSPVEDVTGVADASSPSVDPNSFLYNGGVGYHAIGGGYPMPVATLVDGNYVPSGYGVEEATSDIYSGRNLYYLSQASPSASTGKADAYEQQGVGYESWVPSVPVISQDPNVTVCHGTPLFSAWK